MRRFSALQRAEIAEIVKLNSVVCETRGFSALQRAKIAEIGAGMSHTRDTGGFSALQRAEIAEIQTVRAPHALRCEFQCSSTSRNC